MHMNEVGRRGMCFNAVMERNREVLSALVGEGDSFMEEIKNFLLNKYQGRKDLVMLAILTERETVERNGTIGYRYDFGKIENNLLNHIRAVDGLLNGYNTHTETDTDTGRVTDVITDVCRPLVIRDYRNRDMVRITPSGEHFIGEAVVEMFEYDDYPKRGG